MRFHKIIKELAPNVQTILCIGGVEHDDKVEMEKETEFAEAVRHTDIWSVDKYICKVFYIQIATNCGMS